MGHALIDNQITYVIGTDEDGDHTFLVIDPDNNTIALIQAHEDEDGEDDVVALPPEAIAIIATVVQRHTDAAGLLTKEHIRVN